MKTNKMSPLAICRRLIGLVKPLTKVMILAVLTGSLGHLMAIAIPSLGAWTLLQVYEGIPFSFKTMVIVLLACGLLRGVFHYIEQLSNHYIAFKILAIIRDKVFRALRRLAPAKLEEKDSGTLISVITADIELLEVFYAHTISPVAIATIVCTTMVVFLWQFHWAYGLLAIAIYLLIGIVVPFTTHYIGRDAGREQRQSLSHLNNLVLDSFRGIKECIQFRYGPKRLAEIKEGSKELQVYSLRLSNISGFNFGLSLVAILFSYILFVLLGAKLYFSGAITSPTAFIVPIVAVISSYGPVIALANLANNLMLTFACGERVFSLLDEEPEIMENEDGVKVAFEEIAMQDVAFGYTQENILEDVNFTVKKNEMLGITGKSGSGKSTLLKLIMRYYDPCQGEVLMNGIGLPKLATSSLRDNEGFVAQHTYIFKDTIRNNLLIAKPGATDAELDEACRKASIKEFIEKLPEGYDTQVGELGERLSAGEKQRLGLARAFLHDAPLMLLDEPTANIDSLNEGFILRALDKERANKAICIVSHRPSTFQIVDRMYYIGQERPS